MLNFFTLASSLLVLLAWIIMFFVAFNARESKAYFNLSILFSSFFLLFLLFNVSRLFDSSLAATLSESGALVLLVVFAVYHLKIEGIEGRGEQ